MSGASIRLQPNLLVEDSQDTVRAAASIGPLLLSAPAIVDVAGGAPEIPADLLAPEPRLGGSPLADTEHDRTSGCVECRPDVGIGRFGLLRRGVAPVVL